MDNNKFTNEFRECCRHLEKKGVPPRLVGEVAMKRLGIEKAVKPRYYDEYLDEKMRKT